MHFIFDLSSYSGSLSLTGFCGKGFLTNVPVPSTSMRVWTFSITDNYFNVHCGGLQVASFSRSVLSCISNEEWESLKRVYFHSGDDVSRNYRLTKKRKLNKSVYHHYDL